MPVGRRTYQGSGAARQDGPDRVVWTVRYRVLAEEGEVERELVVDYDWYVLPPQALLEELTEGGYSVTLTEMDVVVAPRHGVPGSTVADRAVEGRTAQVGSGRLHLEQVELVEGGTDAVEGLCRRRFTRYAIENRFHY